MPRPTRISSDYTRTRSARGPAPQGRHFDPSEHRRGRCRGHPSREGTLLSDGPPVRRGMGSDPGRPGLPSERSSGREHPARDGQARPGRGDAGQDRSTPRGRRSVNEAPRERLRGLARARARGHRSRTRRPAVDLRPPSARLPCSMAGDRKVTGAGAPALAIRGGYGAIVGRGEVATLTPRAMV